MAGPADRQRWNRAFSAVGFPHFWPGQRGKGPAPASSFVTAPRELRGKPKASKSRGLYRLKKDSSTKCHDSCCPNLKGVGVDRFKMFGQAGRTLPRGLVAMDS